jgi:alpha-mannosidase
MAQPKSLIVCPTSHMDWDWTISFEEYYKVSTGETNEFPVQQILNAAFTLFGSENDFSFSVAEIGWLQRFLVDSIGVLPPAPHLMNALCLMGGAITSPDNIVCDGEVFVRAYLVGRQWVQTVGLEAAISNVSWLPDDFGHDPELPVILSAMGLSAVAFARVPGAFPTYNVPICGQPSMACALMAAGVAFNWQATDGSSVFAHFMPDKYGAPFYSNYLVPNATSWTDFVQSTFLLPALATSQGYRCPSLTAIVPPEVMWPGGIAFAPAGGDFSMPDTEWVDGVSDFNKKNNGTIARMGTFLEYVSAVRDSGASLVTTELDPSNFYTGFFGSRPALKVLQASASRDLVAAEAASSLQRLGGATSGAALDALDGAITQVWSILAPSSHHDFVTGTSPDAVYNTEQLPMLSLAASLAKGVYQQVLQIIANSAGPAGAATVVVVHNSVGVARGGIFKLERGSSVNFGKVPDATVQPLADGGLLVQAPSVPSLGYVLGLVTLGQSSPPPDPVIASDVVTELTINNGTVAITVSQSQLWAITAVVPKNGTNVLPPSGTAANRLELYQDSGNLYQYGNEPGANGTFNVKPDALTPGTGVQTEFGPLRWRIEANVNGPDSINYRIAYTLIAGESLVRIKVTGSAPAGFTVVTTIPAIATDGATPGTHLVYGTPHHFHDDAAIKYWTGPIFKATHNFLMPAADSPAATFAIAAIYHHGMPSWSCYQGTLLGSLFRNTPGRQRAAWGTDTGVHTQRYALRISATRLDPAQGTPLVESLQFMSPLRAALATATNTSEGPVTLPASASLASSLAPTLVRVARPMGEVASPAGPPIQAQVALRIYRPDADGTQTSVQVTMPVLTTTSQATAELVTALEGPIANAPAVAVKNQNVLSVPASLAVTTVAVKATRPNMTSTGNR